MSQRRDARVAVITGVSTGLGRVLAKTFAKEGIAVIGAARRDELGQTLASEIDASAGRFHFVQADLRNVSDCRRVIDSALDVFGRLDILVNNAAARTNPVQIPLHETDEGDWDSVVDTNLKGAFFCTRFALETMRDTGGIIFNVSSWTGVHALAGRGTYGVSKAGLLQLSRSTAVEYAAHGVRAIAVILGSLATGGASRYGATATSAGVDPESLDPQMVANALVHLCDPRAAAIAATEIAIDQGVVAGLYTSRHADALIAALRS
jgi:NAD(P)-dependent dehydrogenase (short-subunit alcohol dehydrogenase family)